MYGVDTNLIAEGTYFAVAVAVAVDGVTAACGGWSKRKTLYGGDVDAAKMRAFFVHPGYARRNLGTLMLAACEAAGCAAGFRRFEMGASHTGVRLYERRGSETVEREEISLGDDVTMQLVRMVKAARG